MSQLEELFYTEVVKPNLFNKDGLVMRVTSPLSIREISQLVSRFPSEVTSAFVGELYNLKLKAKDINDEVLAYNIAYQKALNYEVVIDCKLNAA